MIRPTLVVLVAILIMVAFWLLGCEQPPTQTVAHSKTVKQDVPEFLEAPAPVSSGKFAELWRKAEVKPSCQIALDKFVMRYLRNKARYESVQRAHSSGVPAVVIAFLHLRESDASFSCHLHEGSSLLHRTRYVPKGRLLAPDNPPYDWEHSAYDAIYRCDKLQGPWRTVDWSLGKIRDYNGPGYDRMGVPNPYILAGTNLYFAGKFTSDGHYSKHAVDQQLGAVAVLKWMQHRGIELPWQ